MTVRTWTRRSTHNKTFDGITVEEKLFLFDTPVLASELVESKHEIAVDSVQARAMFAGDRAMMGERFERLVGRKKDWKEISYVLADRGLMDGSEILNPRGLEYAAVTSWHLTALRNGLSPVVTPTAVLGITLTSDGKIVYGNRGGRVDPNMLGVSPAGVSNGTLLESYFTELREELGIKREDLTAEPLFIGYSTDHRNTKGILSVWYAQTSKAFAEVQRMHGAALQGRPAVWDTKKFLDKEGHVNCDAWEFQSLHPLANDSNYLDQVLASEQYSNKGVRLPLRDAGAMALDIYNHALKEGKIN